MDIRTDGEPLDRIFSGATTAAAVEIADRRVTRHHLSLLSREARRYMTNLILRFASALRFIRANSESSLVKRVIEGSANTRGVSLWKYFIRTITSRKREREIGRGTCSSIKAIGTLWIRLICAFRFGRGLKAHANRSHQPHQGKRNG